MRAIVFDRYGEPDVMRSREVPVPEPQVSDVLIRVGYAGVNPSDSRLEDAARAHWLIETGHVRRKLVLKVAELPARSRLEPPKEFCRIGDPRDAVFVKELAAGRKIEGIICANDFTAAQLMHSLAKAKIRVPEHIRLIGFDNLKYAELFSVPLTTVSQPLRDMPANAIRAMLNRLADPTLPPTTLLSNPSLVIRASCGAFMRR